MATLKIKNLGGGKLPAYAHDGDAGMDLYSTEDTTLSPGQRHAFGTKIAIEIPIGHVGLIWDKSGLSRNHGIKSMGGVVDSTYRGEIVVTLVNLGAEPYHIGKGDKIAQILIQPVVHAKLEESHELGSSMRGERGFGSTGK
ncbi:MAG: deoxyuridine 5'-triphosphate nucleotidohydrolase, dUTP pyrophosphatase [archaeon GW2011_AR3]|nr:MAG: deoxyuridine 5'-triphosphate nucleotidohydrolase, dUTP pyrophosphatase [archaeon GW2011_AR3]